MKSQYTDKQLAVLSVNVMMSSRKLSLCSYWTLLVTAVHSVPSNTRFFFIVSLKSLPMLLKDNELDFNSWWDTETGKSTAS